VTDLEADSKSGDTLNIAGHVEGNHPLFNLMDDAISRDQFWIFGRKIIPPEDRIEFVMYPDKMYTPMNRGVRGYDNHSTRILNEVLGQKKVFSMEPPKGVLWDLSVYAQNKNQLISLYRRNPEYFGREWTDADTDILSVILAKYVGYPYNVPMNFNLALNDFNGTPWDEQLTWLDKPTQDNRGNLVCSVALAHADYEFIQALKDQTGEVMRRAWEKLNPKAWFQTDLDRYPSAWTPHQVHPANYAVCDVCFYNEWMIVGQYRNGKRIA
jgi:hypothetical protein